MLVVTKDAQKIVNEKSQHFRKLNVLVKNAGFGTRDKVPDDDLNQFVNSARQNYVKCCSIQTVAHSAV